MMSSVSDNVTTTDAKEAWHIVVRAMDISYGSFVLIRDLDFIIRRGDIFVIIGGSGCGKSSLMRQLIGLKRPARGQVLYDDESFWDPKNAAGSLCDVSASFISMARFGAR
jgi:ABC-type transporter Mla maintaining outer membrane lipid asymmetry ATPase subunit MlaF